MRNLAILLIAGAAFAQAPPPEVERALRARVAQFFQAHVDGKWRDALAVIAEESQDQFLESKKHRIFGFEITGITYEDEFNRAVVMVAVEGENMIPGVGAVRAKIPRTSSWRRIDGAWYWVFKPSDGEVTPFGTMKPDPEGAKTPAKLPPMPGMPGAAVGSPPGIKAAEVRAAAARLGIDKKRLQFDPAKASSAEVVITNPLDGWVTAKIHVPAVPGLSARIDHENIAPGSTGKVVFDYVPGAAAAGSVHEARIRLIPTRRVFRIRIEFQKQK